MLPHAAAALPERFAGARWQEVARAANAVRPSLIRVSADEVTYGLHIALRFELELALIDGTLAVADLPEAWNERTREYLGLDVPDDLHGVMQDVHWAEGLFGYFPTYALGNVIAGQVWARVGAELPDLDERSPPAVRPCATGWASTSTASGAAPAAGRARARGGGRRSTPRPTWPTSRAACGHQRQLMP